MRNNLWLEIRWQLVVKGGLLVEGILPADDPGAGRTGEQLLADLVVQF